MCHMITGSGKRMVIGTLGVSWNALAVDGKGTLKPQQRQYHPQRRFNLFRRLAYIWNRWPIRSFLDFGELCVEELARSVPEYTRI